eukprot:3548747-Amphidinium_carterae.1
MACDHLHATKSFVSWGETYASCFVEQEQLRRFNRFHCNERTHPHNGISPDFFFTDDCCMAAYGRIEGSPDAQLEVHIPCVEWPINGRHVCKGMDDTMHTCDVNQCLQGRWKAHCLIPHGTNCGKRPAVV